MMMPRTDGGVDKATEEEEKTDKQYDTDHATVKSMSFSHTGGLTHKRFLHVYPTRWAILTLRHTVREWSIHRYVKKLQLFYLFMLWKLILLFALIMN